MTKVGPAGKIGAPLLIIGEAPGEHEELQGEPFVGYSGQKLFEVLGNYGLTRNDVYMMNLSEVRPLNNKFENLSPEEVSNGFEKIQNYIKQFTPNCVLALGEYPLQYLCDRYSISSHRGSVLQSGFDSSVKVVATYHPAYILRNPSEYFLFHHDIGRAVRQSETEAFPYTSRNYYILDDSNIDLHFPILVKANCYAVDIETTKKEKKILCVGFATSESESYSIQWTQYTYHFIKSLLEDESKEKIFHYGFGFDIEVLMMNGIDVRGKINDTYILSHAVNPRLPRGLDFLTSIYTYEPYYKSIGRDTLPGDSKAWGDRADKSSVYIYNAKDCAVTFEIYKGLWQDATAEDTKTYQFEIEDAHLGLEMSRNGMPFSETNRKLLQDAIMLKWHKSQIILNAIAGKSLNVNSSKNVPELLYGTFGLTSRKKNGKLTTDDDALVELIGQLASKIATIKTVATRDKYKMQLGVIKLIRDIRGYRKLLSSYANVKLNEGRVKCMYNVAGTDFGRWSSSLYIDGTGANNQTWPRGEFELPNEGDSIEAFKKQLAVEFSNESDNYEQND